MTVHEIAEDFVGLCRAGKLDEAGARWWADDVVSVESRHGLGAVIHGKSGAVEKGETWTKARDLHAIEVEGPYLNGDQFIVRFHLDFTWKASGQRVVVDEMALFTVSGGKIIQERFFNS